MHEEATLDRVHRQLQEMLILVNNRGNQMHNDVLDLIVRWDDSRGKDFARTELFSLVECRELASVAIRACLEASKTALHDVARGEQMVARATATFEEMAGLRRIVGEDARHARDFVHQAGHDAREGQHLAQEAMALLAGLGEPG